MKNILIIGARGCGRTVHEYVKDLPEYGKDIIIKGFLDDKCDALDGFTGYAPIVSSVEDYKLCPNDVFICALGDVEYKRHYSQIIIEKGGTFFTLIHPMARVVRDVIIGEGTIIAPYASVGSNAQIGKCCLIQEFSIVGHDAKVGDWSRIDTHAVCTGGAIIGKNVTIHTSAVINQKIVIEDNCHIGAGSFVIRRVKEGCTVFGNPATQL